MGRPTIALAMIMKNEEENLPKLFKSIEGCFDEIHITDTGSTDNSVALAKSLGAHVTYFPWVDDFAAARNASFENIKTDYVMWIDGDDVLANKEAFILWRDNAMAGADYWMASYHYACDAQNNPIVSFARERVLKTNLGLRWKYFVHEGVIPHSPYGQVRVNVVNTWMVKHQRTVDDLKKDKSRNLNLFKKHEATLDGRMKFYYGKEHFENQNAKEALKWFNEAITDMKLENHDRILGIQYCAYTNMVLEKFNTAISLALTGLEMAPHRAEFHTIIADCYVKLNRFQDAIPYYQAAKHCSAQDLNFDRCASPLFAFKDLYTSYPRNQLSRVYFKLGDIERAKKEALESIELGNAEANQLLDDINKLAVKIDVSKLVSTPDIVITCLGGLYEWDEDISKERGIGGSETAAVEIAKEFSALTGRRVIVFNAREKEKVCGKVEYFPMNRMGEYFTKYQPDLHIAWRHNMKISHGRTLLWSHDLLTPGGEQTETYEKYLCLSPFHARYVQAMQGIPKHKIEITRNGISPQKLAGLEVQKQYGKVTFSSSADRGLDLVIRVMDRVVEAVPEATLHVYYGFDNMEKMGLKTEVDRYKSMISDRPWVKYHGNTQQNQLLKQLATSEVWLYPTHFLETFCITALEMLACKVYPVTRRIGALQDTLKQAESQGMATMLDHACETESQIQAYADATIAAIKEQKWKSVSLDTESVSWASVAKEWADKWLPSPMSS